jgi:hypothetical protein
LEVIVELYRGKIVSRNRWETVAGARWRDGLSMAGSCAEHGGDVDPDDCECCNLKKLFDGDACPLIDPE